MFSTGPLLLALLTCVVVPGPVPQEDEDVAREWRVRRWALFPDEAAAGLDAALAAPAWEERAAALDALTRGLEAGAALPPGRAADVVHALGDSQPGVRAAALAVIAAGGVPGPIAPDHFLRCEKDPLPLVRLQLARALTAHASSRRWLILTALALDSDARVATAARIALAAPGATGEESELLGYVLGTLFDRRADDELLAAFLVLARGTTDAVFLDQLRARFSAPDRRTRGWRAVVEALALAGGHGGDPAKLVDGWLGEGGWAPRRPDLLVAAAPGGGAARARILRAALDELVAGEDAPASRPQGLLADARETEEARGAGALLRLPHELAEAVAAAVAPARLVELLGEMAQPAPATLALVLGELGRHRDAWDPERAGVWLAPTADREVRVAAVEAFAATFVRTGDAGAGALLVQALADAEPGVEARAWRALCDADDPAPWDTALHAAWRDLPVAERFTRLAWLTRAHPFPAFRADLLALGEHADLRRPAAAELLASFTGDEEVRRALERWLTDEIARGPDEEGETDGAERRLQALVHALGRLDPAASRDALEAALAHSTGWSTEVGKAAAAALGFTRAGRRRLGRFLGDGVDRRTRIEAAIVRASHPTEADPSAAVDVLMADYPFAAWDLRVRMLPALGRARTARAFSFLREVVRSGDEAARVTALHELAARSGEAELPFLEDLARRAPLHETRRLAVRLLPTAAPEQADEVAETLERLFAELAAGILAADRAPEERALLRSDLLAALGATGSFPAALDGEWLRRPREEAEAELRRRFRAQELPAEHFRWAGEITLAGSLARSGRLEAALARSGEWWRLDGRLLLALAEEARREDLSSPVAASLLRAGVVALTGEHARNERRIGLAKGHLLAQAWGARRREEFARLADGILRDRRAGTFPEHVWTRLFGTRDLRRGVAPLARLDSARWQARAWAALEGGDPLAAGEHAAKAARRVGASKAGDAEQARLREALAIARSSAAGSGDGE